MNRITSTKKTTMKAALLFLLIFCVCKSLSAQISVGLSVGNNFSGIKNNSEYPDYMEPIKEEYSIANGLFVGIPVEVGFTDRISLLTTFSYLQKGANYDGAINLADEYIIEGKGNINYNYLELPLQAKYNFFTKNKTEVYFLAGPSFGYLISVRNKYNSTIHDLGNDNITKEKIDLKQKSKDLSDSGYNRLDISIALGVGCDYKVGMGKLFLHLNYLNGFKNIYKQGDGFDSGVNQLNRGFTTTVGYKIPLTKQK